MEEQFNILNKYLQVYEDIYYKEKIYEFSYDSIIEHFIKYKIYKYLEGNLPDQDTVNKELEKIILEIKDSTLKAKLIPLILFLGEEYWKYLMEMGYFDDIHSILLDEFKSLSFKINFNEINEFSYIYQNQQNLIQDIDKRDFTSIIDFNMNPNMGSYQYNHFIYLVANKFFFNEYCQALDEKDDFTFLLFLGNLEYGQKEGFDKRLQILEQLTKNKSLLQIKLLKDILLYGNNEDFVFKTIMDFSQEHILWRQFLDYYIKYPSQHPKLFKSLSKVISQLDDSKRDMLIQSVKIDKSLSDDSKEALNSYFLNIENDEIQKYCLEALSIRWESFIDTSNDYFGSVVATDIVDLVIVYIRDFLDEKIIIQKVEKILYEIEEIDNKWFVDGSKQENYFYKQMSKLFVYSFALEKYALSDLKRKIFDIYSNSMKLKNESAMNKKTTLQLFNEYIFKGENDDN